MCNLMRFSKVFWRMTALVLVVALLLAALPVSAASVPPEKISGNPTCTQLGYTYGYKADPPNSGTYDFGIFGAFTLENFGTFMNWSSTGIVYAVIVKGGPNANLYRYVNGSFGDTNLTTPSDCGGAPCGISHVEVCYNYPAIEVGDAPDSTNHWNYSMTAYFNSDGSPKTQGNFPTVADPKLGAPVGMCHYVAPNGAYLGQGRSAEKDADLFPDPDMNPVFGNVTNLYFLRDGSGKIIDSIADLDSDDGLLLPRFWYNGTSTLITYTVTVPASGVARDRYVNVWFDWNRNGDWGDAGVDCGLPGLFANEHTIVNDMVSVAPGTSVVFTRAIIPCNDPQYFTNKDAIWVRITLSEEPVDTVAQADGRGKGVCYAEGETEDWFFTPIDPSAVTLSNFEAQAQMGAILVTWETAMELDNLGFNLYRAETAAGPWVQMNEALIPAVNPGAVFGAVYTWNDADVEPGITYFYRLEDVDIEGISTFHGPVQATALPVNPSVVSVTTFSAGGGAAWLPAVLGVLTLLGGLERRRRK